eukprot:scaffold1439_cov404-Prasinococcus_capsulatus_cf.AAC.55
MTAPVEPHPSPRPVADGDLDRRSGCSFLALTCGAGQRNGPGGDRSGRGRLRLRRCGTTGTGRTTSPRNASVSAVGATATRCSTGRAQLQRSPRDPPPVLAQ